MHCILLYSKKEQLPVGLFYNNIELGKFLQRNERSVASSISRFRNNIKNSIRDINGVEYEPFDVDLEE